MSSTESEKTPIDNSERKFLRNFLESKYDIEELKTLASDLGIEYQNFSQTKGPFARDLIGYCERRSILDNLLAEVSTLFPTNAAIANLKEKVTISKITPSPPPYQHWYSTPPNYFGDYDISLGEFITKAKAENFGQSEPPQANQLHNLYKILSSVDWALQDLEKAFEFVSLSANLSTPKGYAPNEILELMLKELKDTIPQDIYGISCWPLLAFVEYIALLKSPLKTRLQDWVDFNSEVIDQETKTTMQYLRAKLATHNSTQITSLRSVRIAPRLLIKVEPGDKNKKLVKLSAWVFSTKYPKGFSFWDDSQPRKFQTISAVITEIVSKAVIHAEAHEKLQIEIMLPFDLLSHDIGQWKLRYDDYSPPVEIGVEYPVVVRSWERSNSLLKHRSLYSQNYQDWKSKWEIFNQHIAVRHLNLEEFNKLGEILAQKLRNDTGVACLTLNFTPNIPTKGFNITVFQRIVSAALPVALWPKGEPQNFADVKNFYITMLKGCNSDEMWPLPKKLHEERNARLGDAAFIHDVVLMWDDPNYLPPDIQNKLDNQMQNVDTKEDGKSYERLVDI
jgi:hypothetical protein